MAVLEPSPFRKGKPCRYFNNRLCQENYCSECEVQKIAEKLSKQDELKTLEKMWEGNKKGGYNNGR